MERNEKLAVCVGNVLRKHRKKKGMPQDKFCIFNDLNRCHYSRAELGKVNISINMLFTFADVLETPAQQLITEIEDEYRKTKQED